MAETLAGLQIAATGQKLLRKRRTLIGQVDLVTHQINRAAISGGAHAANRGGSGLPCPHNNRTQLRRPIGRLQCLALSLRIELRGQIEINKNLAIFDFNGVGPEVFDQRRAERLSGPDVKQALMKRALDLAVLDPSIGQYRQRMRAYSVGCKNLTR